MAHDYPHGDRRDHRLMARLLQKRGHMFHDAIAAISERLKSIRWMPIDFTSDRCRAPECTSASLSDPTADALGQHGQFGSSKRTWPATAPCSQTTDRFMTAFV